MGALYFCGGWKEPLNRQAGLPKEPHLWLLPGPHLCGVQGKGDPHTPGEALSWRAGPLPAPGHGRLRVGGGPGGVAPSAGKEQLKLFKQVANAVA